MTLFTSAETAGVRFWSAAAVICAAVGLGYEQFAHGVYSPFMALLFLWPLVGGVLPALALWRLRVAVPWQAARCWRAGLLTLTLGSFLQGVFAIYGSAAPLVGWYWPAGAGLCAVGGWRTVRGMWMTKRRP